MSEELVQLRARENVGVRSRRTGRSGGGLLLLGTVLSERGCRAEQQQTGNQSLSHKPYPLG